MDNTAIPASTTFKGDITACTRLIWMFLNMDAKLPLQDLLSVPRLTARSGLTPPTVRKALAKLNEIGWYKVPDTGDRIIFAQFPNPPVDMPDKLLLSTHISAQARVMYGVLQVTPGFQFGKGSFRFTTLSRLIGLDVKTVRRAIQKLVQEGWLRITRVNQRSPIEFYLSNPVLTKTLAAQKRLDMAEHYGETLMREYLSLIVDTELFEDDSRPGFLVNSTTQERLELDRFYYSHGVAWEYNGPQHYGPTAFCSAQESAKQQVRDRIKAEICQEKHIPLIVVHAEDLTLETMQQKVGNLLPLRDLQEYEMLINVLQSAGKSYRSRLEPVEIGTRRAANR